MRENDRLEPRPGRLVASAAAVALSGLLEWGVADSGTAAPVRPDPLALVAPSRGFDTIHTRLELDIDLAGQTIAGSVTHRMRALEAPLERFELNAVDLEIDGVRIDGQDAHFEYPVAGAQTTSWLSDREPTDSAETLAIVPTVPIPYGQEFTLEVRYHGAPRKGLYWIAPEAGSPQRRLEVWSQGEGEDNRHWIPQHDYPDDRASFEGIFHVPNGTYALSNGVLVERAEAGTKTRFHWRIDQPQVSYLTMLAVARYRIVEDAVDGVPLLYLVPPETDDETLQRGYGMTPDVMRFFNKEIGVPYPYGKYAQVVVQDFIWGGMENTTATVMNSRSLHDASTGLTHDSNGLVAHELAHQWFGDTVTLNEWTHMWLNEGFTSYYGALYEGNSRGADEFDYAMIRRFDGIIADDHKDARPLVVDFYSRRDERNASNVYSKGASLLHMLRGILGDTRFRATIKLYLERHRFGLVDTHDFQRVVRDATGENLDWFFEQWAWMQGHPRIEVASSWDDASHLLKVDLRQTHEVQDLTPRFRLPTTLTFDLSTGATTRSVLLERDHHEFYFELPERPQAVALDGEGRILMDVVLDAAETRDLLHQLNRGGVVSATRAARALATRGADSGVVPALTATLASDRFWGIRREVALALGNIATAPAIDALVTALDDREARLRLVVAETLGKVRARGPVVDALDRRLADDPAWAVRGAALTSLVAMRADGAAARCRAALKVDDPRAAVRGAALNGLADLEEVKSLELIEPLTRLGQSRGHRHTAIDAYARLAKKLEGEERRAAARLLSGYLDDGIQRTRETVIRALATLGDKAAISDLRACAAADPIAEVRSLARKTADKLAAKSDDDKDDKQPKVTDDVLDLKRRLDDLERSLSSVEKRLPH